MIPSAFSLTAFLPRSPRMLMALMALAGLLSFGTPLTAQANDKNVDAGLYDPLPPENSAFVRFFVATDALKEKVPSINGKTYAALALHTASAYVVVPAGKTAFGLGEKTLTEPVEAGKFYTVIADKGLNLLTDPVAEHETKALIMLYNLSGTGPLSVKTADGKVEIIPATEPGAVGSREINPLQLGYGIADAGGKLLTTPPAVGIERGMAYAIFALPGETGVKVIWARSQTDTKQ